MTHIGNIRIEATKPEPVKPTKLVITIPEYELGCIRSFADNRHVQTGSSYMDRLVEAIIEAANGER